MVTTGPENPELATIPFVMVTAAQAGDIEVTMGFKGTAVCWLYTVCQIT